MNGSLEKRLQGLQVIAQEKLQTTICSIPGTKDLILEHSLIKPLERICSASWLKLKGIQRIFKFEPGQPIPHTENVQIVMIRSALETFHILLQHITAVEQKTTKVADPALKQYHIICVPTCFLYFQNMLEEEGLFGVVQLHRFNWDFIHLDQNLLSMEIPDVFATASLRDDTSLLPSIAQSLRVLQMVCGCPDFMFTYGDLSASIVKMLNGLGPWQKSTPAADAPQEFTAFILIDRDRDYASSLLTPAIYSGLLLEVFNCQAAEVTIEVDSNKILRQKLSVLTLPQYRERLESNTTTAVKKTTGAKPCIIHLNGQLDEIYGENRYKHFAQASGLVRSQAKTIGLEVQKLSSMKLDEMHDYVARKLPKITELKTKVMRHLKASEIVIDMLAGNFRKVQSLEEDILNNVSRKRILSEIEELLTTDGLRYNTLRLMCLLHLCAGISNDELGQFIRNYCNYFGVQHLGVFQQLGRAGLLPMLQEDEKMLSKSTKLLSNLPIPKFQQTEFQANANRLKLLVSSATGESPTSATNDPSSGGGASDKGNCPSFVFNGLYIPVVAQLCSFLSKSTSADDLVLKLGMLEKLNLHFGFAANASSNFTTHTIKSYANAVKQGDGKDILPLNKRGALLVYIVGGATYAEAAACDLITRITGTKIVLASDCITSGAEVMSSAFHCHKVTRANC